MASGAGPGEEEGIGGVVVRSGKMLAAFNM